MKIITEIKKSLFQKEVLKKRGESNFANKPITLEKARNIGVLFDATQMESRRDALAFVEKLREQGKRVQILAYLDENQPNSSLPFKYFYKKELDWKGRPVTDKMDEFVREKFEMLFCLYFSSESPLEYVAVQSLSRFKIGAHQDRSSSFDFTVVPDRKEMGYLIQQIEFFLSRLTTTTHEKITT